MSRRNVNQTTASRETLTHLIGRIAEIIDSVDAHETTDYDCVENVRSFLMSVGVEFPNATTIIDPYAGMGDIA